MSYTVNIPESRAKETDDAIYSWLDKHPDGIVEDAIDAIFAIGVNVQLAIKQAEEMP